MISAPNSIGCCKAGVAIVLSTTNGRFFDFARAANAGISAINKPGLLGVSTKMNFVFGVIAAAHASRDSGFVTQLTWDPIFLSPTLNNPNVPPYTRFEETM